MLRNAKCSPRQQSEAKVLVAVLGVDVGPRVEFRAIDEVDVRCLHHLEVEAARAELHRHGPKVARMLSHPWVGGHHHAHIVPTFTQRAGQRARNVAQTARLGKRSHFGRNEQDVHA